MSQKDFGNIITEAWFIIGDAAGRLGAIAEGTLSERTYESARNQADNI